MPIIKIEVTEEDIKKGKPDRCDNCPVALAIKRVVGKKKEVEVDFDGCHIINKGQYLTPISILFSKKVITFIQRFDDRLPVKPFSFTLRYRNNGLYSLS